MTLSEYLEKTHQTQAEFGELIGKSQQLISGYCTGTLTSPRATALDIVKATKGAVTLEDLWGVKIT